MAEYDLDLQSIQEARTLAVAAREAQQQFLRASQAEVDRICAAMAEAAYAAAERLGRMATEETTYGVPEHKTLKNVLCSRLLWEAIKDIPTVGVIRHDERRKIYDIAWPMGVVAALTPSTNPTSTVMFKILIAVKAKDAIVVAPHPTAVKCCVETARIMAEAGERAGLPKGLVSCMSRVTLPGTQELMKHRYTSLILATGGSDMVKAARAYFVDDAQARALAPILFAGHLPNPKGVGKSPQQLAQMCGISVPATARILVAKLKAVGREEPLSGEKLTTVLGWYEANGWEAGCERCLELINYGGRGHSLVIHAQDDKVILQFGLEKPVFRIAVNTLGTLGTTGMTTGVMPSMTLGSGGGGGAITGDNITVHHMWK